MKRIFRFAVAAALVTLAAACGPTSTATSTAAGSPPLAAHPSGSLIVYPPHCTVQDGNQLPDAACTPGAVNPTVTPATIRTTICKRGWTATVRPPLSYTSKVKALAIAAYGDYAGAKFTGYELDHLIPLELGGAPSDVRNLWVEHPATPNPKDGVENAANHAICAGILTLAAAQQGIATDWIILGHRLGVAGLPAS